MMSRCLGRRIALNIPLILGLLIAVNKPSPADAQNTPSRETREKSVIFIGFYNKILVETDIKDVRSAIDYWIKTLAERLHSTVDGRIYDNLDVLREDFKKGLIDWMALAPNDYLDIRNSAELELGPIPLIGGATTRKYYLIVQSASPVSGVKELSHKRIALTSENEGGRLYLNTLLLKNQMPELQDHFSEVIEKRTFAQAILAVFFGQVDACMTSDFAFNTLAELNPQTRNRLKIIAASPALVHAVSVFRKDLAGRIKAGFTRELLNLKESVEGRQVMTLFKIDGMVSGHDSDIESFRQIVDQYKELKSGSLSQDVILKTDRK